MADYLDVVALLGYGSVSIFYILALRRHVFSTTETSSTPAWAIAMNVAVLGALLIKCCLLSLKLLGALLGWHLRRKSASSRQTLFSRVEPDHTLRSKNNGSKSEDDEWERIEHQVEGNSGAGQKSTDDWKGIVGFFHPFWYE